jgi:hypothetical protein
VTLSGVGGNWHKTAGASKINNINDEKPIFERKDDGFPRKKRKKQKSLQVPKYLVVS